MEHRDRLCCKPHATRMRTALKAGDRFTVTMHPLRDGRPAGSLVDVILADGTKIGGDPAGQPNR